MIRKIKVVIASIIFSSCTSVDTEFIRSNEWLNQDGYKIGKGDYCGFKDSSLFAIRNDTLFYNGKPNTKVIYTSKYWNEMKVSDMSGKEIGYYTNYHEFRR